jgi:hypothetical protein
MERSLDMMETVALRQREDGSPVPDVTGAIELWLLRKEVVDRDVDQRQQRREAMPSKRFNISGTPNVTSSTVPTQFAKGYRDKPARNLPIMGQKARDPY